MAVLDHTVGVVVNPDSEWKEIRKERSRNSFLQVFVSHVPFLALIPVVAGFIGVTQVGWSLGGSEVTKMTFASALNLSAVTYAALLAAVYLFGEFVNWMSRRFGVSDGVEDRHYEGTALAVYATTPMFLAGIVLLYPSIWINAIVLSAAAAYSGFLVFKGIPALMNISKGTASMYATMALTVGLMLIAGIISTSALIWVSGIGPVYTS